MSDFLPLQVEEEQQEQDQRELKQAQGRAKLGNVVLDKDGRPCRTCMTFRDWAKLANKKTTAQQPPEECPPDVEVLGRATWTFLHTMAAQYPEQPTALQQAEMKTFLRIFSRVYPCWHCAEEFQQWMNRDGNAPRVESREALGRWLCEGHNNVSTRLGKKTFDCNLWRQRWRDGCQ